jgi:phosphatidylglycerophosphatase A
MRFPNYNKVSHVIATCFGVGSIPFAPGTWGSLFTVLLVFNITFLQDWIILVAFLVVALSWWVCVEVYKDTKSDSSEILSMNLQECL